MPTVPFAVVALLPTLGYTYSVPRPVARSHPSPDSRIAGGTDADIKDFPYLVALETKGNKGQQFCVGALITPSQVLTAAQCLYKPEDKLRVRVGSTRRNKGGTVYEIAKHVRHPKYNENSFDYDVGIVHLEKNVTIGELAQTIKVANVGLENGAKLTIAGWGMTEEDGELSPILQKGKTAIMDRDKCTQLFQMYQIKISERMMCTQGNGTDACVGDGGAPAVYNGFVNGIASWGIGCGRPNFPAVEVNVTDPDIRSFIRAQTHV